MTAAINLSFPSSYQSSRIESVVSGLFRHITLFGLKAKTDTPLDWAEISSRLVTQSARALRLVTLRTPKAHVPHDHVPDYILIHVIETLECGHTLTVYPQADPLIAKRRLCHTCQSAFEDLRLPPKKPVESVKANSQKAGAA